MVIFISYIQYSQQWNFQNTILRLKLSKRNIWHWSLPMMGTCISTNSLAHKYFMCMACWKSDATLIQWHNGISKDACEFVAIAQSQVLKLFIAQFISKCYEMFILFTEIGGRLTERSNIKVHFYLPEKFYSWCNKYRCENPFNNIIMPRKFQILQIFSMRIVLIFDFKFTKF